MTDAALAIEGDLGITLIRGGGTGSSSPALPVITARGGSDYIEVYRPADAEGELIRLIGGAREAIFFAIQILRPAVADALQTTDCPSIAGLADGWSPAHEKLVEAGVGLERSLGHYAVCRSHPFVIDGDIVCLGGPGENLVVLRSGEAAGLTLDLIVNSIAENRRTVREQFAAATR